MSGSRLFTQRDARPAAPRLGEKAGPRPRPPSPTTRTAASGREGVGRGGTRGREPAEHAGLDRAAPATLGHSGGVAGAEAGLAHRALRLEVQPAVSPAPTRRACR